MKSDIFKKLEGKSKIITGNYSKYIPPLFTVVVLQKIFSIQYPELLNELLFKVGKSLGKLISSNFKQSNKNINQMELVKYSLLEMAYLGFGKSEVSAFNPTKKQIIIKNFNNPWAKQYKKSFGRQNKVIDFFVSGIYSGIFSSALQNDCFFEEQLCICGGNNFCTFHLTPTNMSPSNRFEQDNIDSKLSEKNLITDEKSIDPNVLVQKMFSLNHITSEGGELKVWTIYCIMLPFELFHIIFEFLNKKVRTENIFLYLGMTQAKIGILFQIDKFGIKKGDDTFKSGLQQLELFGLGKYELVQHNEDFLEIKYKNYNPLMQHKKMFSNEDFHTYHSIGIILGIVKFSYDKIIKSYSTSIKGGLNVKIIFTKNKSESFFDNLKKQIKSSEIKEIIEEKMKHQYYLN